MSEPIFTISLSIEAFLKDIGIGHSPATVKTYKVALNRFSQYLVNSALVKPAVMSTKEIKTDWAVNFLRWLATSNQPEQGSATPSPNSTGFKVSKSTLATYGAALVRFYTWCSTEGHLSLTTDEFARLNRRIKELRGKTVRTIINKVPADEVLDQLLKQVRVVKPEPETELSDYDKNRHLLLHQRNIALLETLKSTGGRVSEICDLKRGDLDNTNRRARVIGKGSKERWVYFSPVAWEELQQYFSLRSKELQRVGGSTGGKKPRQRIAQIEGQPVFCRHDRGAGSKELKALAPRSIEKMLWQIVEEAGLETYITPHKFRHWFATRMLAATGDLATTQDLLGHASPTTTRIYAQVSEQRKQTAHREVFGKF